MKLESVFKSRLKKDIKLIFSTCIIIDTDSSKHQGLLDMLILYNGKWAMLECKRYKDADHRPNQDYYVDLFNEMGFAAFIYPENKNEVLSKLTKHFNE